MNQQNNHPLAPITPCHKNGQHILTIGSAKICAGNNKHSYNGYKLIINISDWASNSGQLTIPHRGAELLCPSFVAHMPQPDKPAPPELEIAWRDGSAPALLKEDWLRLIDDLSKINGRVYIHCIGGHGRTGTALVVLAALSGAVKKDPVAWLRKFYCKKVVETEAQIKYIKSLGIKTNVEIKAWVPTHAGWFYQEQYELTKGENLKALPITTSLEALYKCLLCARKKRHIDLHQTFMDMTGFCWDCHQATRTPVTEIQSA